MRAPSKTVTSAASNADLPVNCADSRSFWHVPQPVVLKLVARANRLDAAVFQGQKLRVSHETINSIYALAVGELRKELIVTFRQAHNKHTTQQGPGPAWPHSKTC